MKPILVATISLLVTTVYAQHTFSIVAVDSVTGEIGSAGATCGDSIIWPSTKGAIVISDIVPGLGAIHTQALWASQNQSNAHSRLLDSISPDSIIKWLVANDYQNYPKNRQYGIVTYNDGHPLSAAFTGSECLDHKNHITGPYYSIQGNILLGEYILDSMEARFLRAKGPLADRLMAAMQGANVVGADSRCTAEGTSSLSAFIRVARPNDAADKLYLDKNVAGTAKGVEPIDELQKKFDKWASMATGRVARPVIAVYPNPVENNITIELPFEYQGALSVYNSQGAMVYYSDGNDKILEIATIDWLPGVYTLRAVGSEAVALQHFVKL